MTYYSSFQFILLKITLAHEVNSNVTNVDFIVNCSTETTDLVISNPDNISEELLSESYLENVIQEFKILAANVKDFQSISIPNHDLENKFPNWFISISDPEAWKKGTALTKGEFIMSGWRESKMSFGRNIKAHLFPGTIIQDMYYYWCSCYVNTKEDNCSC